MNLTNLITSQSTTPTGREDFNNCFSVKNKKHYPNVTKKLTIILNYNYNYNYTLNYIKCNEKITIYITMIYYI